MSDYVENREIFSDAYSMGDMALKREYILTFTHTATGHNVSFPATVQNFSDSHATQISEQIFADRMDPLIQQASTTRNISFSFVVTNSSIAEARYNERSINLLLQMMYPKLANNGTVAAGSYIEISGINFFQDSAFSKSITCLVQNINYSLNIDEGFITPTAGEIHPISITIDIAADAIIPKSRNQQNPYPDTYPRYR